MGREEQEGGRSYDNTTRWELAVWEKAGPVPASRLAAIGRRLAAKTFNNNELGDKQMNK
jgi:hypothetical protein